MIKKFISFLFLKISFSILGCKWFNIDSIKFFFRDLKFGIGKRGFSV